MMDAFHAGVINLHLQPFPALIVIALILLAFGLAVVSGFTVFAKYFSGWRGLVRRFPATDAHSLGKEYGGQSGLFDRKSQSRPFSLNSLFLVEPAQEGLLVTAYFARRQPILLRWSDIQKVEDQDLPGWSAVLVTAECDKERKITVTVPKEALTVIRSNVPPERWHKTNSFTQLIKNRLINRTVS